MHYREPLYRPPSEADSLIFQVSYGCPHNTCLFCPMYKGVKYEVRDSTDLLSEIRKASRRYPETRRIFLADGDVMKLPFRYLTEILGELNFSFSNLSRVSVYANGSSILEKTMDELTVLKSLKLHTHYMGLETGDEELLSLVRKGETAAQMTEAVNAAQKAGLRMCVFALLGLGGKLYSARHAENTAEVINRMSPGFFAVLRFIQVPGYKMFNGFTPQSEYESVAELYNIISGLELKGTVFRSDHTSVPIPLSARFPKDKESLLGLLTTLLNSSKLDRKGMGHVSPYL